MVTPLERRQVLIGAVSLGGVAALAACSSSSGGGSATSAAASSSAASSSAAPTSESPSASATESTGFGVTLVATKDVPVGGGVIVENGGQPYAITQPEQGTFKCFNAVCPHQGCACNKIADGTIDCPCHGSTFAIATGDVVQGPATSGLAAQKIEVRGTDVVLLA